MGSAAAMTTSERQLFKYIPTPASVPPVPIAQTNPSTRPAVCSQISGPVDWAWPSRFPVIWEQTAGRVDGFVCAIGTGGTLAGVGMHLKSCRPEVVVAAADPMGAAMYHWFK